MHNIVLTGYPHTITMLVTVHESLSESFPATPEAVGVIRRNVSDYARALGIDGIDLDDVRVAVSEAATNVVRHAYRGEPGAVHVSASAIDDELWVLIADDGVGPNRRAKHPGLGWGLAIITDATEQFTLLERTGGGTEARMCFRIHADRD
jgi:serine/threonine-protein kinase RsbW